MLTWYLALYSQSHDRPTVLSVFSLARLGLPCEEGRPPPHPFLSPSPPSSHHRPGPCKQARALLPSPHYPCGPLSYHAVLSTYCLSASLAFPRPPIPRPPLDTALILLFFPLAHDVSYPSPSWKPLSVTTIAARPAPFPSSPLLARHLLAPHPHPLTVVLPPPSLLSHTQRDPPWLRPTALTVSPLVQASPPSPIPCM
ncbi:hypothetical protein EDB87DRAFT_1629655 [Lactarius vividus]|nr:hypothetical protein EDB87DRAFT_1629655 [Lactarius vividus]